MRFESSSTLTGANADRRLASKPDRIAMAAIELGRLMGAELPDPRLTGDAASLIQAIHRDLIAHVGHAVVLAGPTLPAEIHALAHWINAQIQAPIDFVEPPTAGHSPATLADLRRDLHAGRVESLAILDCNPAYDASPDLEIGAAARRAKFRVHLGPYADETSALCDWHIPQSHPLESWSDLTAFDGTASLTQPLIAPLYATRSPHELIAAFVQEEEKSDYDIVRESWRGRAGPGDFETWWRRALHDGVIAGSAPAKISVTPKPPSIAALPGNAQLSLVLRPDTSVFDGSFANNAWLQELPKPLTKEVWGNSVAISREDAESLGVSDGDVLRLAGASRFVDVPARIDPRQVAGVFTLTLGYGRAGGGGIGQDVGASAYVLRNAPVAGHGQADWLLEPITATKTGEHRTVPSTQHQFVLDGRSARALSISHARRVPEASLGFERGATGKLLPRGARGRAALGNGDRHLAVHRLQRVRRRLPGREQLAGDRS